MKLVSFLSRKIPAFRARVEKSAYAATKELAENHRNSPRYWYTHRNDRRITAFFKNYEEYERLVNWDVDMPNLDPNAPWKRLDHGYDEDKIVLDLNDLQGAAQFRGEKCLSKNWNGDMYSVLIWECAFGHAFSARPFTVLKVGYWCPSCEATWSGHEQAKRNPFFAQVEYADHSPDESNFYPEDCINDIKNADLQYEENRL